MEALLAALLKNIRNRAVYHWLLVTDLSRVFKGSGLVTPVISPLRVAHTSRSIDWELPGPFISGDSSQCCLPYYTPAGLRSGLGMVK